MLYVIGDEQKTDKKHTQLFSRQMIGYVFALLVSSLVITGCGLYRSNHTIEIPLIKLLNNASLYPNDPFAATLPGFASMLWRLVALLARVIPLTPLLIGLFVLERLLIIYAAGFAAQTFAPRSKLATISTMALFALAPVPLLAQGTIVTFYFEQTGLSIAFVLFAIAAFYHRKPVYWAICLALVFNLQSMYGAYALTYFGASFFIDPDFRRAWRSWAAAFGLFVLLSLPNIWLTCSDYGKGSTSNSLWVSAAYLRFSAHLCPLTWGKSCFLKFGSFSVLAVVAAYLNERKMNGSSKHVLAWAIVGIGWIFYAFVAEELRTPAMLVMQPGRATDIWCCFAAVVLVSACAVQVQNVAAHRYALLAGLLAAVLFWQLSVAAPIIVGISLLIAAMKYTSVSAPLSGIRLPALVVLLAVVFVSFYSLAGRISRARDLQQAFVLRGDPEVAQIARWARKNTPADSVFLTNLFWAEFRAISERPVYTNWKDGAAILWDRPFVTEWTTRLRTLGLDVRDSKLNNRNIGIEIERIYSRLDDKHVQKIRQSYLIDYWVVRSDQKTRFPIVYRTKSYKVLRLPSRSRVAESQKL